MQWEEVRQRYPHQWLLVEAVAAHSSEGRRILDDLNVVRTFRDAKDAMRGYKDVHSREPLRELYVLHTDREQLDIGEIRWLGLRTAS